MTELEAQIINLIRASETPEQAARKIIELFVNYCPKEYCHLAVRYGEKSELDQEENTKL